MAYTINSDGLTTTGICDFSDILAILNFYRTWFTINYSMPNSQIITLDHWVRLKQSITDGVTIYSNSVGVNYTMSRLPNVSSGNVDGALWPSPSKMFASKLLEYTSPGTYQVTLPLGITGIKICRMIGGGCYGGGGSQNRGDGDGSGGGGGSGGYIENTLIPNIKSTDIVSVSVGGQCGNTSISVNGQTLYTCTGGGQGGNGYYNSGGGAPGQPNGNAGTPGISSEDVIGGYGADSPLGYGGHHTSMWMYDENGWSANGYGAGGQGGGSYWQEHTHRHTSDGGSGSGGCAQIVLYGDSYYTGDMPPKPAGSTGYGT